VKILVGFGPGGLGDIVTRSVAQKLSAQMGQPFVIENANLKIEQ
jgi:tripartite-type tricarboxylate transporter receptor subunit TctC